MFACFELRCRDLTTPRIHCIMIIHRTSMYDAIPFAKKFAFRRDFMKKEEKRLMSIGEIAKALDITRRMILNYEAKGLIEADVKEGLSGNRYYTVDTLTRIRTIRVFQNLGLSLGDIKEYFDGNSDLRPMIARLEKIRDELNLNIEKLKERVREDGDFEIRITTIPAQTVFCKTFRAETVDARKEHLRKVIPEAMRGYASDTSKRMYFIEYPLSDADLISYCVAVTPESEGRNIRFLEEETALCVFYHGSYETIPDIREKMLAFASANGLRTKGICRHIYLEGPAQHREEKDFITQVVLPIEKSGE